MIRKDLLLLSRSLRIFAVVAVLFAAMALLQQDNEGVGSAIGAYLFIMVVIMQVYTVSADEQSRWLRMEKALPLGPRQVVLSKYLVSLLCILVGMAVYLLLGVRELAQGGEEAFLILTMGGALLCAGVFLTAVQIPLQYRFGSNASGLYFWGCCWRPWRWPGRPSTSPLIGAGCWPGWKAPMSWRRYCWQVCAWRCL